MFDDPSFRRGARESSLLFFATGAFGLAYGVLAVEAGLSPWLATFSSIVIVSGSAQFAMLGLLPAGPVPVLLSAAGLGLRHLPMSASLAEMIGPRSIWSRLRLAYILVDETFGLTVRAHHSGVEDVVAYKTAADLVLYSGWMLGTVTGAWFGSSIDPEAVGIGVFFPLLFLGLAVPLIHKRRDLLVGALAVGVTLIASLTLPQAWQLTAAATVAALIGAGLDE